MDEREEKIVATFEKQHPDGATSIEILTALRQADVRISEATFRKYVQLGLLPRSRRVGGKGKHEGSWGLYPPWTVRQVIEIKKQLASGKSIEEIASGFTTIFGRCREAAETIRGIEKSLDAMVERTKRPPRELLEVRDLLSRAAALVIEASERTLGRSDLREIAI